MTMRLKLYTLLCISFLLIFTACNQDDDPVPAEKVTRTVLAYIMAITACRVLHQLILMK